MKKSSGLLLHVTSLPGRYGIGDLGPAAYAFIDALYKAKQSWWQLLPLNPTESVFGHSPYSSCSAFAVNPLLVSPELMVKEGWIDAGDLKDAPAFETDKVDYAQALSLRERTFDKAYAGFKKQAETHEQFHSFCEENQDWLEDYALFVVLKDLFKGASWSAWPDDIRDRRAESLERVKNENAEGLERIKFIQFAFFHQWAALKQYAHDKGVRLIGDMPIYVSYDSVDVWTRPDLYKLKEDKTPIFVAGVPPDYFSETGQRWGNPVYDWDKHQKDDYAWWMRRLAHNLSLFDCVRIDHFRGLVAYWEIPAEEPTAVNGYWVRVPHDDFLSKVCDRFTNESIIAEDLGLITPDVTETMEKFGFPGMKVLLFAFNGDMKTHPYLPHNYTENFLVYPGTHDNNTIQGWYAEEASEEEKKNLEEYVGETLDSRRIHWTLINLALESKAKLAVISVQDVLGLGAPARMNTPGTTEGNWQWRMPPDVLEISVLRELADKTEKAGRGWGKEIGRD